MTDLALNKPRILPPKGLLIALAAQLPILVFRFPLRPSALEMIAGAAFLAAGVVLNVWAERLFRHNDVGVCPFTPVPVLIERGPYGVSLLSGALSNIWSSVAFLIWLHYAFALPEEAFLRREVGEAFDPAVYDRRRSRSETSPAVMGRRYSGLTPAGSKRSRFSACSALAPA